MKFNSQICTTKEQSERLLVLGLKKETADCVIMYYDGWHIGVAEDFDFDKDPVEPAWSLHRLIEMIPKRVPDIFGIMHDLMVDGANISYYYFGEESWEIWRIWNDKGLYDNVIDCIKWLIEKGHLNKEYLEE